MPLWIVSQMIGLQAWVVYFVDSLVSMRLEDYCVFVDRVPDDRFASLGCLQTRS